MAVACAERPSFAEPVPTAGDGPAPRDLRGSHTTRVEAPCSLYVKPGGSDRHDGRSLIRALRTPSQAVRAANSGDVVCFDAGTYPPLEIRNKIATAAAPIVFRAMPGAERKATFSRGSLAYGRSVSVEGSAHIHVYDLRLTHSQGGIGVDSSSYCRIEGLVVEGLGQEAIHLCRKQTYGKRAHFVGPASHHCDVIGNTVRDTGKTTARYGEGVYIGSGRLLGDDTHDVFIAYNQFDAVRAEAVELKPFTYNHIVRGNLIRNSSHEFHAAITVAVQGVLAPDCNALIEDNRIYNYGDTGTSVAGITVGHGTTTVRNNLIWAIDGGRGIRTTTTFANPSARDVLIEHNTIWTPGPAPSIALHDGDERTGMSDHPGHVTVRDNVTDDGSAGSLKVTPAYFVGPIDGPADAGRGPGSGLRARKDTGVGAASSFTGR